MIQDKIEAQTEQKHVSTSLVDLSDRANYADFQYKPGGNKAELPRLDIVDRLRDFRRSYLVDAATPQVKEFAKSIDRCLAKQEFDADFFKLARKMGKECQDNPLLLLDLMNVLEKHNISVNFENDLVSFTKSTNNHSLWASNRVTLYVPFNGEPRAEAAVTAGCRPPMMRPVDPETAALRIFRDGLVYPRPPFPIYELQ